MNYEEDGRELRTLIRNDCYNIDWSSNGSYVEIPIGQELKEEYGYGYHEKLRLEIHGKPNWKGEQGRLEIEYDGVEGKFRAYQPVTIPDPRQDSPLAEESAALDIGANNIAACTTSEGKQYLYEGRELFQNFRETTERIAEYQSKLAEEVDSSKKIKRLYRKRTRRRNHAQDALVRGLVERVYEEGVAKIYVGDLGNVLEEHWKAEVNEKTHNFWAFSRFIERLNHVSEEYGIEVEEEPEAWTTQECPRCGETDTTTRHGETLTCTCGYEGHADLKASRMFLEKEEDVEVGLMAQPVRFEWDNHEWRSTTDARLNPKEQRTDLKNPQRVSAST